MVPHHYEDQKPGLETKHKKIKNRGLELNAWVMALLKI
jgi:hypothetical protein